MTLPAVPDSFHWTHEFWGPALRCRPLEVVAPHLFTTRQPELSSHADWERLAAAVGATHVATLTQVHGRDAVVVRAELSAGSRQGPGRPAADILVSQDSETALAVRAADCVPLLIADPDTGAVAAVHAGWRGTAAGAATAAVEALAREFGTRPRNLIAAIGPSIGACCYEVGPELIDAFLAAGHSRERVARWFMTPAHARPRLDTWAANRDQLMSAGVLEDNIHISGLCTASNVDVFPSYRVEKERTGRLVGVIRAAGRAA
jgi:YfiH family protein